MSETAAKYETGNLDRDELLSNGFQCIYHEQFEEAIRLFDRAIEMEPDLLTCQARALCETFLLTDPPNVSQVIKIISNLTEALRLAVEHFEITPDTWTAEKFNDGETDSRHERYSNWSDSSGFAAYPTDVEVVDLGSLLNFTYLYRTNQLD